MSCEDDFSIKTSHLYSRDAQNGTAENEVMCRFWSRPSSSAGCWRHYADCTGGEKQGGVVVKTALVVSKVIFDLSQGKVTSMIQA